MPTRSSSLQNSTLTALAREIDSQYDAVKTVSDNIDAVVAVASEDLDALVTALNQAKDFTGITVVTGASASWDPNTKVLTVPTVKGDKGDKGDTGVTGTQGIQGLQGIKGDPGRKGDIGPAGMNGTIGKTPEISISYNEATGNLEYTVTYVDSSLQVQDEEW